MQSNGGVFKHSFGQSNYKHVGEMLSRDFTADEIKEAIFQMGPTKAPELDGMNALFYKKF